MIKEFQLQLLVYLATFKDAVKYYEYLDRDIFDFKDYKAVFDIVLDYHKSTGVQGKQPDLLQHLFDFDKKKPLSPSAFGKIDETIKLLFVTVMESNPEKLREKVIEYSQYKMTANVFKEYAPKLKTGNVEIYREVKSRLDKVLGLENVLGNQESNPGLYIPDIDFSLMNPDSLGNGFYTPFTGLDGMLGAGGIMSPELFVFVAEAKFGKTALLLNLALWYWCCGLNVYYADGENGEKALMLRVYQAILQCVDTELFDPEQRELLKELVKWYNMRGGRIRVKNHPANITTVADMELDMMGQQEDLGIKFDVGLWDYADLWLCNTPSARKDKRVNIQHVYHDIIGMHTRNDMFGFTVSQINKKGKISNKKKFYYEQDLDEDFAKTKNCHKCYGVVQTPDEAKAGVGRIHVVCQRRGTNIGQVFVTIDRKRQVYNEISKEEAIEMIEDARFD